MDKGSLIFGDIGIDKCNFHCPEYPMWVDYEYIDKILISNKVQYGKKGNKHFIGYKDDDYKIKPLCIMLPKISGYAKSFDGTKYMLFLR